MEMPLNAKVYCDDGLCGQSKEVLLDRKTEEVTHLVVKGNHLPHTERLVPVELVAETTPHLIRLRCKRDELAELEPFLKTEVIEERVPHFQPDPYLLMCVEFPETKWITVKHETIPQADVAVRQGARVEAVDGHVGRLDESLVDPVTECAAHIVVHEEHLWGQREMTIPVSETDRLEEDSVYLQLDRGQVGEALALAREANGYTFAALSAGLGGERTAGRAGAAGAGAALQEAG